MPENILVVEYEPRYTDRVRQALAGQPFTPLFAKDGEEALRAIEGDAPRLIVLSSVVPKVSTPELIRAIRNRNTLSTTPILLTVSGYNGKSPKQDAVRMGASDILPKPYSESEFLGKVQQMLGVRAASPATAPGSGLTSNEIFGDLLEEGTPSGARKTAMKPKDDVDKMLADTLSGLMPQRKKDATQAGQTPTPVQPAPAAAPPPPAPPKPQPPPASPKTVAQPMPTPPPAEPKRTQSTSDLDKLLSDTLSGTRKPGTAATQAGTTAVPRPAAPPPPSQPAPPPQQRPATQSQTGQAPSGKYITEKLTFTKPPVEEKVVVSQPVFPQAPLTAPFEEEEPTDGTRFGQYVLQEKIATGGMAEVWKARMRGVEGFQKTVAIKKILPHLSDNQDFIEMFIDEAKLAAQLNHNNIIHIYDLGKIQGSYYIAMEYIDGYDLKTILKLATDRDQPINVELALFVASKIAAALDYAHRKRDFDERDLGLVHRDVSPQNVLISQEGDIKLCDFGIAKAASKASHTQAGALKGKLQYMSPEQAWGRTIDKRSDIFALATVLFDLLTGRKLFTGDNELSILEQVREARITPPSQYNDEVTPQIDAIVVKALQKDPANRYQTAGEMERDINQVLYSFKPTPTAADLAIYMHRLSTSEAVAPMPAASIAEPEPVREPGQLKPASAAYTPPAPAMAPAVPIAAEPAADAYVPPAAAEKKSPIVPIVIAAVVVIAAVGGWLAMRGKSSSPAAATTTAATAKPGASPVVPTSATSATTPPIGAANAAPALGVPPTATTATFDPSKVDAEVAKRLAAEKARLDAEAAKRQQQQQQTPTQIAQTRPTPQPVVPVAQPVAPTPQPVVPAPQPVVPQPVPQPVVPQPQPAEPQVVRAREGDLIPAGTDGLNPPRMTRQGALAYPQVARIQRVEGPVIMSVLVSESGAVQDVRVIRGDPRLTEAAVQTVKRSGFSPGTKDGVRVKSWIPVTINFKL